MNNHTCELDETGRCRPCLDRFDAVMRDTLHHGECHTGHTQAVSTPLGFRLLRFTRKIFTQLLKKLKGPSCGCH